jgi:hypothetical protein
MGTNFKALEQQTCDFRGRDFLEQRYGSWKSVF